MKTRIDSINCGFKISGKQAKRLSKCLKSFSHQAVRKYLPFDDIDPETLKKLTDAGLYPIRIVVNKDGVDMGEHLCYMIDENGNYIGTTNK